MLIRLDKVKGCEHVYNIKLGEDVANGSVLERTTYNVEDNYNGVEITDIDNDLVMIVEEFLNETGYMDEKDYTLKKDTVVRGYTFEKGDVITVSIDGITSATNVKSAMVGKFAIPVVGAKQLSIDATAAGSLAFKVIDVDVLGGEDALVLEVQ